MGELGETIRRAREKMGWSQADLAARVSACSPHRVNQQAIDRIERGETKFSRATTPILATLGLDEGLASPAQSSITVGPEIPIIGLADLDEGGISEMRAPFVGSVPRPQRLIGVPDIYAVYMRGSSMAPMYRSGDLLVIDPHQAPRLEDGALFVSKDRDKVRISEYAGETAKEWICKRWGEKSAEFTLKKSEFPYCECVYSVHKRL